MENQQNNEFNSSHDNKPFTSEQPAHRNYNHQQQQPTGKNKGCFWFFVILSICLLLIFVVGFKNSYSMKDINMSTFLGIGLGPIQTGIFLSGAAKGGFDEIVIAEVDNNIKDAINSTGGKITINIAAADHVYQEEIPGIKVYNPLDEKELECLIDAAARADELATALPSVDFFKPTAAWLVKGFAKEPQRHRLIYTAENNNHAAEILQEQIGSDFPNTHCLNTVVGKMSGIINDDDCKTRNMAPLCSGSGRGHLVEEFNKILISTAEGVENRKCQGLYEKADLYPFEEAKLYGHNAIHYLLGITGKQTGKTFMSELSANSELMAFVRSAFIDESGQALCKKYAGVDDLFTEAGFKEYAEDLLVRMTNPFLQDTIERITRDPARKLSWNDRVIGTMRVILSQGITPTKIASGAALAAKEQFGDNQNDIINGLKSFWNEGSEAEHQQIIDIISESL
jgi:mannitol-1-phosphate 5-dehydrogenase